jgi:hypothetical protein
MKTQIVFWFCLNMSILFNILAIAPVPLFLYNISKHPAGLLCNPRQEDALESVEQPTGYG